MMTAMELQSDEYIVCDECGKLCIYGDCPSHGPMEWVDDMKELDEQQKSNARTSLPSFLHLMPSAMGQGLGVFTKVKIDKRVMFGPFKGQKVSPEDLTIGEESSDMCMFMWDVLKDGKVNHIVDGTDEECSNWTRFVKCARSDQQQNLVALQFRGEIYYKTCKVIESGSELLVWYSDRYTMATESLEQDQQTINGWDFFCDKCRLAFAGSTFLLRHKALRCPGTCGLPNNSSDQTNVVLPSNIHVTTNTACDARASEDSYVVVNIPILSNRALCDREVEPSNMDVSTAAGSSDLETEDCYIVVNIPLISRPTDAGTVDGVDATPESSNRTRVSTNEDNDTPAVEKSYVVLNVPYSQPSLSGSAGPLESDQMNVEEPSDRRASTAEDNSRAAAEDSYVVVHIPFLSEAAVSKGAGSRVKNARTRKRPLVDVKRKKRGSAEKKSNQRKNVKGAKRIRASDTKSRLLQSLHSTSSLKGRTSARVVANKKKSRPGRKALSVKSKKSKTQRGDDKKVRKTSAQGSSETDPTSKKRRRTGKVKAKEQPEVSDGGQEPSPPTTEDEAVSSCEEWSSPGRLSKKSSANKKSRKSSAANAQIEKPIFSCDTCGKTFKWKSSLDYHQRSHASEKAFKCTICDKGLSQHSSLKRHLLTHSGEKPFKCDECSRGFVEAGKLAWHKRVVHTGQKPEKKYKCSFCEWCFALSANLRSHMRTHTGERPFPCPQCGKCFRRSPDVISHLRSHTGERPYKCSHCGKGFTMLSHKNRHEMIHTGEKPFKCNLCGKAFNQKVSVAAHLQVHARRQERLEKKRAEIQNNPAEQPA